MIGIVPIPPVTVSLSLSLTKEELLALAEDFQALHYSWQKLSPTGHRVWDVVLTELERLSDSPVLGIETMHEIKDYDS